MQFWVWKNHRYFKGLLLRHLQISWIPAFAGMTKAKLLFLISSCIALFGCSGVRDSFFANSFPNNPEEARMYADHIANENGFRKAHLQTDPFIFTTYQKIQDPGKPVSIYIEGDGHSRTDRGQVSADPTPYNPLALKLAVLDPSPNVVYLARPCQYTDHALDKTCVPMVWSELRFNRRIIYSMNQAVDQIKHLSGSQKIHLIGFSGGAACAALISASRVLANPVSVKSKHKNQKCINQKNINQTDIASLRTVAGDLDHEAMTAYHKTIPLPPDSLNPIQIANKIANIPQHHFAGEKDKIVPPSISEGFVKAAYNGKMPISIHRSVLKGVSHHEGWEKEWPVLLKSSLVEES